MNTSKSRPLAKVFWPVMLLTAALSLPVDTQAAPSPKARHEHSEKADRGHGKKQEKQQDKRETRKQENRAANQDRGRRQGQEQRAQAQQRAELQRQQKAAQKRQAELQKKAELQRQSQLQQQRKLELQRKANLQRQAELQRKAELQRRYDSQRTVQRSAVPRDRRVGYINGNAGRYRYYDRNNGRYYESRYGRGDTIVVDGYLTNEGGQCQALRDDNGELYMLVGNTYGLRRGDHARVTGRVVDGGYCDWEGTAFEIADVKALWADRRHQTVYYHHSYDGESFGSRNSWVGRRPRAFENRIERYGYYDGDRNRYDDRYRTNDRDYDDRDGNRQLIVREGRLYNNRGCTVLDAGGDTFALSGDLRGHRSGDKVKVTGFLGGPSGCADRTIQVGEIR
jgi:hypothetical protein